MLYRTPASGPGSLRQEQLRKRAEHVALLAFRCARHDGDKQDIACAVALKAYQTICPHVSDASDEVIALLSEALRARPHWAAM